MKTVSAKAFLKAPQSQRGLDVFNKESDKRLATIN